MKKAVLFFLLVLLACSLFASAGLELFGRSENYIPDHLVVGTGNDKYDYGITRNDDDQLSYSFLTKIEAPLWYLGFDAKGYTNRGWREGWDILDMDKPFTSSVIRGRFDSLETVVGLKVKALEDNLYLHFYPEVGVALVGDCGWEWGQNALHRISGIHEVELPYETPGTFKAKPIVNGRGNFGYKLKEFSRTSLIGEVEVSSRNIFGFQSENQVLGRVSISTQTHDLFGFHVGYMYASSLSDTPNYTQDLYLKYLNGWRIGFTLDSGLLALHYTGTPRTGFGFGSLSVDLLGFFAPREWAGSDIYLTISRARMYGRNYNHIVADMDVSDKYGVVLSDAYLGGNPVLPGEEKTADLTDSPRLKRAYVSVLLGVRYSLPTLLHDYVNPYVIVGAGLQSYKVYSLLNQLADTAILDGMGPSYVWNLGRQYYPMLNGEVGVAILPEDLLVFHNTSVQLQTFGGVNVILGPSKDLSRYKNFHKYWETGDPRYEADEGFISHLVPYFGVGLRFGFDL